MDKAVQVRVGQPISDGKLVSAHEKVKQFGGDNLPKGLHFVCPCCMRKVVPTAFSGRNKIEAHFRHKANDDLAQLCENYMSSSNDSVNEYRDPIIPLFLWRTGRTDRFIVEIGFWLSGDCFRNVVRSSDSKIIVEEKEYPLWQFANPTFRIPIEKLHLEISNYIRFTGKTLINNGKVEDAKKAFVFNDDFGENGGRRVRFQDSIKPERDYYIVTTSDISKEFKWKFDKAEYVGTVQGDGKPFSVTRIRISANSAKRKSAEQYLASFGYYLTEYNRSAQLVWPPSINIYGIDNPIFHNSPVVYNPLFRAADSNNRDGLSLYSACEKYEMDVCDVGLIGNTSSSLTVDFDSWCVFMKPGKMQPWLSIALDKSIINELKLSDLDESTITLEKISEEGKAIVEIRGKYPLKAEILKRNNRAERVTIDFETKHSTLSVSHHQIIRLLSSDDAFPKEWQLRIFDTSKMLGIKDRYFSDLDQSIVERRLIAEQSRGYRIAKSRIEGRTFADRFENRSVLLAKEGRIR